MAQARVSVAQLRKPPGLLTSRPVPETVDDEPLTNDTGGDDEQATTKLPEEAELDPEAEAEALEAAAIAIQSRIRGRQDRGRAAAKRLVESNWSPIDSDQPPTRLDMSAAEWLEAQGESELIDMMEDDFGAGTLREVIAVVQDPLDWMIFIPDDQSRCNTLWRALQKEVALALA